MAVLASSTQPRVPSACGNRPGRTRSRSLAWGSSRHHKDVLAGSKGGQPHPASVEAIPEGLGAASPPDAAARRFHLPCKGRDQSHSCNRRLHLRAWQLGVGDRAWKGRGLGPAWSEQKLAALLYLSHVGENVCKVLHLISGRVFPCGLEKHPKQLCTDGFGIAVVRVCQHKKMARTPVHTQGLRRLERWQGRHTRADPRGSPFSIAASRGPRPPARLHLIGASSG